MRDVCPKCLRRVKPEHVAGTGQGYAQLWRCPECGVEEKMCRWLFKLPEEKTATTPEQDMRNREKKTGMGKSEPLPNQRKKAQAVRGRP